MYIATLSEALVTKASGKFAVVDIHEKAYICKSYTDSDIVKIDEQASFDEKFTGTCHNISFSIVFL